MYINNKNKFIILFDNYEEEKVFDFKNSKLQELKDIFEFREIKEKILE